MHRRTSLTCLSILALVAAVFALAMPANVHANDTDFIPGSIVGRCVDEKGEPVAGAQVRLTVPGPRGPVVFARTETDRRGMFEFPRVRPGHYAVRAAKREVGTGAARASVRPGQTVRVPIELSGR